MNKLKIRMKMKMKMKKFFAVVLVVMLLSGVSHGAAKWKELVFTDDIEQGMAELTHYCNLRGLTVADVLWANNAESADIQAGKSLYLPANHAELLAIWQNRGAWQPTALVPVTSAAAAKRAAKNNPALLQPKPAKAPEQPVQAVAELPVPKSTDNQQQPVASVPVPAPVPVQEEKKAEDELIERLREEVKTDARNLPRSPKTAKAQTLKLPTTPPREKKVQETPANVIANTAKPDKILTGKPRKSASSEIPGLMDPIIILSPNGDPSKGPMRLMISGDKVEVVQLPKSAAPKRPSMADLDHTFGTSPSYLPHYNLTAKPRDPFILNMGKSTGSLSGKMMWPVDGKISSPFGKWRGSHKHQGIDIPMPAGTPIRAAKNGVVIRTGNNSTMGFRGYGNFVLMDHGGGFQTFYAHCLSVSVVQGQRVMQGQIIGYVGSTGRSTANHLHFEVRVNNTKVDPAPYLAGNTQFASKDR